MGCHGPSPREEFCFHLQEAADLLARASRQLRLASAFAPCPGVRGRLEGDRRRVDALRRRKLILLRRLCPWCW